ncbi:MAG: tetratricopeptide repeat protein [Candidatus Wallbacteria bacterium]|nr:tetratricopeptide repeat protein [Candidatus Wallbacteria bacterium]
MPNPGAESENTFGSDNLRRFVADTKISDEQKFEKLKSVVLNDSDPYVRAMARKYLELLSRHMEKKAPPQTTVQPDSPKTDIAKTLRSGNPQEKISFLKEVLANQVELPRYLLFETIGKERDPFVLATLISCVGRFGTADDGDQLSPFFNHKDPRVKANTIEAARQLKSEKIYKLIVPLLQDADPRVKANAAGFFSKSGLNLTLHIMEEMVLSGDRPQLESAIFALSHIPDGKSKDLLNQARKILSSLDKPGAQPDGGASEAVFDDGFSPAALELPAEPPVQIAAPRPAVNQSNRMIYAIIGCVVILICACYALFNTESPPEPTVILPVKPEKPQPVQPDAAATRPALTIENTVEPKAAALKNANLEAAPDYYLKGKDALLQGNNDLGLSYFSKALAEIRTSKAYLLRGLILQRTGKYRNARSDFSGAFELSPALRDSLFSTHLDTPEIIVKPSTVEILTACLSSGVAFFLDNYESSAYRTGKYALDTAITAENAIEFHERGLEFLRKGKFREALRDFSRAIEIYPMFSQGYASRGLTCLKLNDSTQALTDLNKAIEFNPKLAESYYARSRYYASFGNLDSGISDCTSALSLRPGATGEVLCHYLRGELFLRKGKFKEALKDLNCAIGMDPDFGPAYVLRSRVDSLQGDSGKAKQDLRFSADLLYPVKKENE